MGKENMAEGERNGARFPFLKGAGARLKTRVD